MEKNSSGYVVTLNDQTKYYFNNKLEMYRMEDPHGDTIEISAIDGNHVRTVTDSTGRLLEELWNIHTITIISWLQQKVYWVL